MRVNAMGLLQHRSGDNWLNGISRRYLEVSAVRGDGPPMIRVGSRMVRYRVRDLREWIDGNRVASTSDRD